MFTLARLRTILVPLARANSTLQSLSSSPSLSASSATSDASTSPHGAEIVPTSEPTRRTRGRRNPKYPAIRPSISLERPREWNPPVAPGFIPAYDEAVAYIRSDAAAVQAEADALRSSLEKGQVPAEGTEDAKKRLDVLEIMAQVNLPEVRWKAANGMADMSQKVYRHLIEQRWRKEGALDLLMERLYQMHVIPDILPGLQPTVDLRAVFPEAPPKNPVLRARAKRKTAPVEAGVFLVNEQTRRPPKLYTTVFHPEPRLYTLLMVDPDVPDEENQTFKIFLHWLQPNITLSATSAGLLPSAVHTPYLPPHPARGTPYHRYVLLLLPHEDPTVRLSLPPGPLERDAFDVRSFVQEHALRTDGGGAFMWRAVWDEESSTIWRAVIKNPEPRYGYPPKPDPYATLKEVKKYA
ncbi:phosphatidylethanolamine-binding protein [Russula compacta]|nr:phosphatidylethanolamine-binding protein [Russula compacta]